MIQGWPFAVLYVLSLTGCTGMCIWCLRDYKRGQDKRINGVLCMVNLLAALYMAAMLQIVFV